MRKPYASLLVHLVWATWDRLPLTTPGIRPRIHRCIQAEAFGLGCEAGAIGGDRGSRARAGAVLAHRIGVQPGQADQGHLLAPCAAPDPADGFFKWQGSYGAFSIAHNQVELVRRYIRRQEEHHLTARLNATLERTFIDEPPPHHP